MKVMRVVSAVYGACCLVVVCALLFLLIAGSQSDLGRNILLLFLASFWSGVPLLFVSAWSLKSKRAPARRVRPFAMLASLAPSIVYLISLLSKTPTPSGEHVLGVATSIALAFLPTAISLVLLLSVLKGASHET